MPSSKRVAPAASAFPNNEESLALQASLLEGDRALAAWQKLSASGAIDGGGVSWIAPMLMQNIMRLAPADPWVKNNPHFLTLCRLKGVALTDSATAYLNHLEGAGIPTLALKGLALGATVYAWQGLRTVSDLDILVPREDFFRAAEVLKESGLKPGPHAPTSASALRANHAHPFYPKRSHELSLDLHWHVLASARRDDDDASFWADAQPLLIGRTKTRALCVEDQLLHVLVHGVRWTRMPHVRWVADAALLLRHARKTFRTERFLEALERFDAVTPAQEGLRFLTRLLGEGEELFERVRGMKRSRFARHAFKARATAYESRTVADRIALRIESAVWSRRSAKK